jgi:pimeloyl-ACP methyl ester carboxylesterase
MSAEKESMQLQPPSASAAAAAPNAEPAEPECLFFTPPAAGAESSAELPLKLAYCSFGAAAAADVQTVLFLPGAGFGRLMCPVQTEWLVQQRIRLIVPDRPGYGASEWRDAPARAPAGGAAAVPLTPEQILQYTLESFSATLALFLTSLQISPVVAIAHSAGCVYLMHFAATFLSTSKVSTLSVFLLLSLALTSLWRVGLAGCNHG